MQDRRTNCQMLVVARKSRGLTQQELAEQACISQGQLSKYEIGEHEMPRDQLAKIAEVLGYPESFFFEVGDIAPLPPSVLYHRRKQRLGQKKLQQIEALVNVLSLQLRQLLLRCEVSGANKFPAYDIEDFQGNASRIAQLVRAHWHLPRGPIGNLTGTVENACGVVMKCDFGTRDFDGLAFPLDVPGPVFFMNKDLSTDRLRFTLAHEIGHVVMHRTKLSLEMEEEAHEFAAELLMPRNEILDHLRPFSLEKAVRLKLEWKVSIAALARRARDLQVISESQYKRFCSRLSTLGYRMNEPIPLAEERPSLPANLVEALRQELKYSYQEIADIARCSLRDLFTYYLGRPPVNMRGVG
jgi:Zn-dependent peptidase ImmA (M78 family)/transcriptional regulator with XRE-family HTH domain